MDNAIFWQIFCFVVSFSAILMLVVAEKDISYLPTKRYGEIAFLLAGLYTILLGFGVIAKDIVIQMQSDTGTFNLVELSKN